MANEKGDMKLLGNFRKLIDSVAAAPNYKPSNTRLEVANLETQYDDALASVEDIPVKMAPNKVAINNRQTAYEAIPR